MLALVRKLTSPLGASKPSPLARPTRGVKPSAPKLPTGTPSYYKPLALNGRDIEAALRAFLSENEPGVARFLTSTWNAEREAIKFEEVRNAVQSGQLPSAWMDRWRQDYSAFINSTLEPRWRAGIFDGGSYMARRIGKVYGISWSFPQTTARMEAFVNTYGASLISHLTQQQTVAVRNIVNHFGVQQAMPPKELARLIRPVVGLTPKESSSLVRFYDAQLAAGAKPEAASKLFARQADYLNRVRADRIARSETAMAYNYGAFDGVQTAVETRVIKDPVIKTFQTADDERVCEWCGPMDGQIVELNETFPGRTETAPFVLVAPLHPNCRCTIGYEVLVID